MLNELSTANTWIDRAFGWVVTQVSELTKCDWRDDSLLDEIHNTIRESYVVEGTICRIDDDALRFFSKLSLLRDLLYSLLYSEERKCRPPEPEDFDPYETAQNKDDEIPF